METRDTLAGKVAIVTGGGRGLGRAYVEGLAAAGARVAVADMLERELKDTAAAVRAAGSELSTFALDVTQRSAVEDMVQDVERRLGPVDLLVNNAGIARAIGPIWQIDPDDWWREVAVNLYGEFLFARTVLPSMLTRRAGRIINVASTAGKRVAGTNMSAYGLSKAAVIRLTDQLAAETADHGIKVFAIHPGGVVTHMMDWLFTDLGRWMPAMKATVESGNVVGTEVATALVLRLASGEADALSGCYIEATSNLDELIARAPEIRERQLHVLKLETL
ncbi:MAG TPA: SDR family oxidoreductase [Chloroflexota bacterium]|nr:SDR family oxidoreductase [Chloroflexota bacterium]